MNQERPDNLRVVLAEDETLARLHLSRALSGLGCEILAEFRDGSSLITWLEASVEPPDVLFLDIWMPGATGIQILKDVGRRIPVVLVTAHPEFAIQAFEFAALDFLVKPVHPDRLKVCLNRVRERLGRPLHQDLRASERIAFRNQTQVRANDQMVSLAPAINLSHDGLLLASQALLPPGITCLVEFSSVSGSREELKGTVVRSDTRGTAIKFTASLDPARFGRLASTSTTEN